MKSRGETIARVRLDVACNDPDNGLFAHVAEGLQIDTWDGQAIEFSARRRAPRFAEHAGHIQLLRRKWPILAAKEWYGNWCWNAYWLEPRVAVQLLAAARRSGLFECDEGPSALFDNWQDEAEFDERLWLANLLGRPLIGEVAR